MPKALTVKAIESIRAGPTRREIPDGRMPGLYFVVQPTGAKSWAVRYRHLRRTRKLTLGKYPRLKLAEAREHAGEALRTAAKGRDPSTEKLQAQRRKTDGISEADLVPTVLEHFLARHVRPKNRTAKEVERLLSREIARPWANRGIQEIARRDVVNVMDAIIDRGSPYTASRVFTNLRKMLNWCVERGIISASPMAGIKRPMAEESRDRILTDDEVRWFWRAANELGFPFGPHFLLLLLTGQRRGEVRNISRSEIDLVAATWTIPKERSKNNIAHSVPLSSPAVGVLVGVPITSANRNLIFSTTGTTAVTGYSNAKERVDAKMLNLAREEAVERREDPINVLIPSWRLHDLRRTAASGMARLGHPVHVVEAVLNHKSGTIRGVAAVYNRYSYAEEKRKALESWGRFLEDLTMGAPATKVVALKVAS